MSGVVPASRHTAAQFIRLLCDRATGPLPASVAVIVAHPDDEVIGLGSRLPRLPEVALIHVTDGSPANGRDVAAAGFDRRADYARARRRELGDALALAGVDPGRGECLDCPDQGRSRSG